MYTYISCDGAILAQVPELKMAGEILIPLEFKPLVLRFSQGSSEPFHVTGLQVGTSSLRHYRVSVQALFGLRVTHRQFLRDLSPIWRLLRRAAHTIAAVESRPANAPLHEVRASQRSLSLLQASSSLYTLHQQVNHVRCGEAASSSQDDLCEVQSAMDI